MWELMSRILEIWSHVMFFFHSSHLPSLILILFLLDILLIRSHHRCSRKSDARKSINEWHFFRHLSLINKERCVMCSVCLSFEWYVWDMRHERAESVFQEISPTMTCIENIPYVEVEVDPSSHLERKENWLLRTFYFAFQVLRRLCRFSKNFISLINFRLNILCRNFLSEIFDPSSCYR